MAKVLNLAAAPFYQQIADDLKMEVASGKYSYGEKIPTEDQLCELYGVSRITIRNAIESLCKANILVKLHGKGTFVSMPVQEETFSSGSFSQSCLLTGLKPGTIALDIKTMIASSKIAKKLGIKEYDEIMCIHRLRTVDDVVAVYEEDYFRADFFSITKEDIEKEPLLAVIHEKTGIIGCQLLDVFDIALANSVQAGYLECEEGTPLLLVEQVVKTVKSEIVYYNKQYVRADRYKYGIVTTR